MDQLRVRCRFSMTDEDGEGWASDADVCDAVLPQVDMAAHEANCGFELVLCHNVSAQVRRDRAVCARISVPRFAPPAAVLASPGS